MFTNFKQSFVDGAGGQSMFPRMWERMKPVVDDYIVASLDETKKAMRLMAEKARVISEGAGALSVAAALTPSSALSAASSYGAAGAALGEGIQPSLILQSPTLLSVLEGAGLSEDPTIAPIVPYLRPLTTIAGGTKSLRSSVERFRLVLTLRGG